MFKVNDIITLPNEQTSYTYKVIAINYNDYILKLNGNSTLLYQYPIAYINDRYILSKKQRQQIRYPKWL